MLILLFILSSIAGCMPATSPSPSPAVVSQKITVLAAASLTEAFTEIGGLFESQHPGVEVTFSFAGSQQLAQQLGQGAAADVFASASPKYMDVAVQSKRVSGAFAQAFAQNRLVVIFPKSNPGGIQKLADMAKPGLKLDLADKAVPVGQYSLDFLDKAAKDPAFPTSFKEAVLKNVVSYEENVRFVLTKVSLGEADAGIIYVTDITSNAAASLGKLDIPDALNSVALYPIAPVSDSAQPELAKAFVAQVLSKDGQAILAEYGFLPAP